MLFEAKRKRMIELLESRVPVDSEVVVVVVIIERKDHSYLIYYAIIEWTTKYVITYISQHQLGMNKSSEIIKLKG